MPALATIPCNEDSEARRSSLYETTDLYLGCYLKASGIRVMGIRREGKRATFLFEVTPDLRTTVLAFYNEGVVRVNDFKNALQDLKAMVYNY